MMFRKYEHQLVQYGYDKQRLMVVCGSQLIACRTTLTHGQLAGEHE
jgi:hypothetical protein